MASQLNEQGYATLLFDLLTSAEEAEDRWSGRHRFDIGLLASRLVVATDWLGEREDTAQLPLAYFGGRPDLAGDALTRVHAPTLLIVGGNDREVLALNHSAQRYLQGAQSRIAVVSGATHLFEEPGALDEVSRRAAQWLDDHLAVALTHA